MASELLVYLSSVRADRRRKERLRIDDCNISTDHSKREIHSNRNNFTARYAPCIPQVTFWQ